MAFIRKTINYFINIFSLIGNQKLYSLIGVIIYAGFEVSVVFILARTFSQEIFGDWILFYSLFFLFDRVYQGFYGSSIIRFLSGAINKDHNNEIIGSGWVTALIVTSVFTVLIYVSFFFLHRLNLKQGFLLFFIFYPLISFIRIPFINSLSILQVKGDFKNIIILRIIGMGTFTIIILINLFYNYFNINQIILIFIATNILNALVAIFTSWSGISHVFKSKWLTVRTLIKYGKYSMGTSLGSNLLRDSDIFLIGIFMRSQDVALYGIPLRLIDILNIPLAAIVAIVFPAMSKASQENDNDKVKKLFYKYTFIITILFIPFLILMAVFSRYLVWFLGGEKYILSNLATAIFLVFLIYGLLLTTDRFIGITLDSINKPHKNFVKVTIMALINIIGDIVVILIFKSLLYVAFVTILNITFGVFIGLIFLKKEINIEPLKIFSIGFRNLKKLVRINI